jgi:hypothetical protein
MINDISSLTISFNCLYQHVTLFNEFNDKFDKLDNDCWIGMFNIEYSFTYGCHEQNFGFVKFEDMSLVYNHKYNI